MVHQSLRQFKRYQIPDFDPIKVPQASTLLSDRLLPLVST